MEMTTNQFRTPFHSLFFTQKTHVSLSNNNMMMMFLMMMMTAMMVEKMMRISESNTDSKNKGKDTSRIYNVCLWSVMGGKIFGYLIKVHHHLWCTLSLCQFSSHSFLSLTAFTPLILILKQVSMYGSVSWTSVFNSRISIEKQMRWLL